MEEQEAPSVCTRRRLLAIHRRATAAHENVTVSCCGQSFLSRDENKSEKKLREQKLERLYQLRRRRIELAAQVAEMRCRCIDPLSSSAFITPGNTLFKELQDARRNKNETDGDDILPDAVHQYGLAMKLRQMRQKKCLAAAYRLSGISIFSVSHEEVLALRFDIGAAACYHCFFDVVVDTTVHDTEIINNDEKSAMLFLRLVQHTLPPSIPLAAIVQRHLGGVFEIGQVTADQHWKTAELLQKLRAMANQIYHACHCLQVRKETYRYLEQLAAQCKPVTTSPTKTKSPPRITSRSYREGLVQDAEEELQQLPPLQTYSIDCLEGGGPDSSYKMIRFHLRHRLSGIAEAVIALQYPTDLCRHCAHQPATVAVQIRRTGVAATNARRCRTTTITDVVSDVEDEDHNEFIQNTMLSFRRLPIRQAMHQVTDAMAEW